MYGNFTARVEEVLQVTATTTTIEVVKFTARLEEVLNERLDIIASAANVSSDSLIGLIFVTNAGDQLVSGNGVDLIRARVRVHRRQLATEELDVSKCNDTEMRINVQVVMESATAEERNRFVETFENANLPEFIQNVTGTGDVAKVCAPAAVTEMSRETVDAPPPPPPLALTTDSSSDIPIWLIAAIAASALLVCCMILACFYWRAAEDEECEKPGDIKVAQARNTVRTRVAQATTGGGYVLMDLGKLK